MSLCLTFDYLFLSRICLYFSHHPLAEQDENFIDDETVEVHAKKHSLEKAMIELTCLHLCGSKKGISYCGIENCALPGLRLQVSRMTCIRFRFKSKFKSDSESSVRLKFNSSIMIQVQ